MICRSDLHRDRCTGQHQKDTMIFCIKLLYVFFACTLSSTAADPEDNLAVTSGRDDEFDKKMAAATLSKIAEDFNSTASKQVLLAVSEALLIPAHDEDVLEAVQIGEVVNADKVVIATQNVDDDKNIGHEEDKKIIDNVLLGIRAMPDNATIWELFKAQVQADFAPILIIIPRPIQRLIGRNIVKAAQKLQVIFLGPTIHMICVAGRVVEVVGKGVVRIGEDIIKVSHFISSADNYVTEKNVIPIQKISETDSSTRESVPIIQDEDNVSISDAFADEETNPKSTFNLISGDDLISDVSKNNVDSDSSTAYEDTVIDDNLYNPLSEVELVLDSDFMDLDAGVSEAIEDNSEIDYIEI